MKEIGMVDSILFRGNVSLRGKKESGCGGWWVRGKAVGKGCWG